MKHYFVVVLSNAGQEVRRISCGTSERRADKVDDGVNISLNHESYYTEIQIEDIPDGEKGDTE